MKTNRREKQMKLIAAAALILGIFSPLAQAAIAEKDGVSLSELKQVVQELEIQQLDNNRIVFAGIMPKGCADDIAYSSGFDDGEHRISIKMPNFPQCKKDHDAMSDEEKLANEKDVAEVFPEFTLDANFTGPVMLRRTEKGRSANSTVRSFSDKLNFEVVGQDKLNEESEAERLAQEEADAKLAAEEALKAKNDRLDLAAKNVAQYCVSGEYSLLSKELLSINDLMGDVSTLLASASLSHQERLKKDLNEAATGEEAQAAYSAYLDAALTNGWDEAEIKEAYMEKRYDIVSGMVADAAESEEVSLDDAADAVESWFSDLKAIDGRPKLATTKRFAEFYGELGAHAMNNDDASSAERYLDRAKKFTDLDGRIDIDSALSKFYAQQAKACIEKNPGKMGACDKLVKKAMGRADKIEKSLGKKGGEEGAQAMAAFQAEKIQTFGGGMSMNYAGIGMVSQIPGAIGMLKAQTLQQYQQQMMMQQMYGGQAAGAEAPRSGLLGF